MDYITTVRTAKRIIDGKVYNTETAELVGHELINTSNYLVYQLYKKKRGDYFILVFEQMGGQNDYIVAQHESGEFNEHLAKITNLDHSVILDFEE